MFKTGFSVLAVAVFAVSIFAWVFLVFSEPVMAGHTTQHIICQRVPLGVGCGNADGAVSEITESVISVLLLLVSAVSVLVMIIAGFMYVVSGGNPETTKRAKNAIIYALVGIVVAVFARAIVFFVLTSV